MIHDVIFGANFLDKFGFTLNYNEHILQWMNYKISLINLYEFFITLTLSLISTKIYAKLKKTACLNKRSSTTMLLKYSMSNTIKLITTELLPTKNTSMYTNSTIYNLSWLNTENALRGLLVSIPTKNSTLNSYLVWNQYTIVCIWSTVSTNKHSKKKLKHIIHIEILEECSASKMSPPYFIVTKKDGQVR